MGLHRITSLLAIQGDQSQYHRRINMIRFWNRVLSFDHERITRLVFNMDYNLKCLNNRSWCGEIKKNTLYFLNEGFGHYIETQSVINISLVEKNVCILLFSYIDEFN